MELTESAPHHMKVQTLVLLVQMLSKEMPLGSKTSEVEVKLATQTELVLKNVFDIAVKRRLDLLDKV